MATAKSFRTRIDIAAAKRKSLVDLLNRQLADTIDLYSQFKEAHWNVKGPSFIALHELFDESAASLLPFVDDIAERATTLGGRASGTVRRAAAATRLPELTDRKQDGRSLVEALAASTARLAASTRAGIEEADSLEDADTADLLTGVSRGLDKTLWFLEAHLQ